jgi:hypothetical protein
MPPGRRIIAPMDYGDLLKTTCAILGSFYCLSAFWHMRHDRRKP